MPNPPANWLMTHLQDLTWWEVLAVSVVAAFLLQILILRTIVLFTRRTTTDVDERIVSALRWPLLLGIIFVGIGQALGELIDDADLLRVLRQVLWTLGILIGMRALSKVSDAILDVLARRADDFRWIDARSLPLYEILAKLLVVGAAIYGLMLVWSIDVTAWLASAGILGLAIGFAAKDTLANLFAGIFILADAPYKLGDFITLGTGERGKVTDIGIRSTRILTRDDIEVTIPNAAIANGKIINESSGPSPRRRVRVNVSVSYDSDLDHVRSVLEDVAAKCELLDASRPPSVRVRGFGADGVDVQVRGYIPEPVLRGRAVDRLCSDIFRRFREERIEIPFPQRVVHMAETAGGDP